MQDASGRGCPDHCSAHGVCQNASATCICDTGFLGHHCGIEVGCDSMAVEGRCFSVFQKKVSWKRAEERCRRGGGLLALVSSPRQQLVLAGVLAHCNFAWIGLSDAREEGEWEWGDGTAAKYTNWAPGEPNNKGNEDHVILQKNGGRWLDVSNSDPRADCFACSYKEGQSGAEGEEDAACARDCSGHGTCGAGTGICNCAEGFYGSDCSKRSPCEGEIFLDRCFVVYPEPGHRPAAERKCRERGGHLAHVQSSEHETMLLEEARAKQCRGLEMWIGLNDEEREGSYVWPERPAADTDYLNWLDWEPNNGAAEIGAVTEEEEDGVVMDRYGWADVPLARSVPCFVCEFEGSGLQDNSDLLSRRGAKPQDTPVIFNFFAPDLDPVLRRVTCVPGSGRCEDDEGLADSSFACAAFDPNAPPDEDEYEYEVLEVEEVEGGEGGEGDEEEEVIEEIVEEEEEDESQRMPATAALEPPPGQCRAGLSLMNSTAERCWRSCLEVLNKYGEEAGDGCRQMCFRVASQINEDMSLVAMGDGAEVMEYYDSVNISDPSKVGSQGSEEEQQVRTEALVHNVWASAIQVGSYDKAEKELFKLSQMHPKFPMLHFNLGVLYASQGRLQEAKACYRRCAYLRTGGPQCRSNLGNILLQQGHVDQAMEVFQAALKRFPQYAPLHSGLAAARLQRGDNREAYESAMRALRVRPQNVHYRLQAALAARRFGSVRKAVAVMESGLTQPGDADDAMLHQVMAELSTAALSTRPQDDMSRFKASLCTDRCTWQTDSDLYGSDLPLFRGKLREAMLSYRLAARALRQKQHKVAACVAEAGNNAATKCGRSPPDSELYRVKAAIADLWGMLGAWNESRSAHEVILAARPSFSVSLIGKAAAAAALEDYQTVGIAVETAVQHGLRLAAAPSRIKVIYGSALLELARAQVDEKAWKNAMPFLQAALRVDATRTMPYAVDAWRMLCKCYYKTKHPEPTMFACQKALEVSPLAGDAREALEWAKQEITILKREREAKAKMRKDQERRKREAKSEKQEQKEHEWTWQTGDGGWSKGRGGGKGNKWTGPEKGGKGKVPRGMYDILELKPTCTKRDIRKAYHRLALKWHPDKNPDNPKTGKNEFEIAQYKFQELTKTYEQLLLRHVDGAVVEEEAHCINC
mmetsp:Transcript_33139/g.51610  ORF Transcript_33139/g.51610 Transcript_33139/m.51610 type:complete len:1151 (+) Transcript_33139:480-3932(+)